MTPRKKPVGRCGPMKMSPAGPVREFLPFPADKAERERMIANLFVLNRAIPKRDDQFGPFANPRQNGENDLDFTIDTNDGAKLLELAEFAPLAALKTSYEKAPRQLSVRNGARLFFELIMKKSEHQGGANRLLLIYKTHDAFFVSPPVQELVLRWLRKSNPRFDGIYYLSPHDSISATVFVIYPRNQPSMFVRMSDEELENSSLTLVDLDVLAEQSATQGRSTEVRATFLRTWRARVGF